MTVRTYYCLYMYLAIAHWTPFPTLKIKKYVKVKKILQKQVKEKNT